MIQDSQEDFDMGIPIKHYGNYYNAEDSRSRYFCPDHYVYISGPISTNPNHEHWFDAVERYLWATNRYDQVYNPDKIGAAYEIEHPFEDSVTDEYKRIKRLERDARFLEQCGHIVFMPGWDKATGCIAEYMAAKVLHLNMIFLSDKDMADILIKFGGH